MATMSQQGTAPAPAGDIEAEPIADTLSHIITTYNGNNADENNVDYTSTDGVGVLGQAQEYTALKTFTNTSNGGSGIVDVVVLTTDPASVSQAANDGLSIPFKGDDAGGTVSTYAQIEAVFTSVTAGSEQGEFRFKVAENSDGALDTVLTLNENVMDFTSTQATTELRIDNTATDGDPILSFQLGGTSQFTMGVDDGDSDKFKIGTTAIGASTWLTYDGTVVTISGNFTVGVDDTGHDAKFFGATSGSYLLWDESADSLLLTDSTPLKIGDSQDLTLYHDGTNSYVTNAVGALKIATETSGIAVTIGHTTSETTIADNATVTGDLSIGGNFSLSGVITGTTLEATGDTSSGDNAAIGYTSAEGLILTGQGATSDVTLKNDADATVFTVPTGTDDILLPDSA